MFKGSMVALVTPMRPDGKIDEAAWSGLLDWHLQAGTDGVVVAGTTGESVTLSTVEFSELLGSAVIQIAGRIPVMAGTGSPDTRKTIERTRLAAELGADAALVVTPSYNRPTQRGLEAHFLAVAEASSIPVILYNVPARTAVDMLPETSIRLSAHQNIVAIKEAVGDAQRVAALRKGGLSVLSGDDPTFCERMIEGADGVISVAANVVPEQLAQICRLIGDGELEEARRLDSQLHDLYEFMSVEPNPVPVKWVLAAMGRTAAGIRLPLVPLDERFHAGGRALIERLSQGPIG